MRKFIFAIILLQTCVAPLRADLVDKCRELLRQEKQAGPVINNTPQITQRAQAMADRVSTIFSSAIENICWPDCDSTSEARKKWRSLTIQALTLSSYIKVVCASNAPNQPLSSETINLIASLMKQTETCLTDFCDQSRVLESRGEEERRSPFYKASETAFTQLGAHEDTQLLRINELSRAIAGWASSNLLTPETLTRIILAIRIPKEKGAPINHAIRERLMRTRQKECTEIGKSVLNSITQLSSHSLRGWRWGAAKLATNGLKLFDTEIGAFVLSIVEDEESLALPILERLIQSLTEPTTKSTSESLKADLERAIDEDLNVFVQQLINDNPSQKKYLKQMVSETLKQIKPMLVDLIWNKDARLAEQLLFHYLPIAFTGPAQMPVTNLDSMKPGDARLSQKLGRLSAQIAANYLWREDESHAALRHIFIESIRTTAEQVTYHLLNKGGTSDPNLNAMRSAETLTMLHLFLEDYKNGVFRAHSLMDRNRNLNQPLIDVVFEILQHKYPGDSGLKHRVESLMQQGSETFFHTVLDPKTISNLVIQFDFPNSISVQKDTTSPFPEIFPDCELHKPFGKSVVRALRSFLDLGDNLNLLDKSVIGILNKYHEQIGKRILTAQSTDYIPILTQLLFKQGTEPSGKARLFVGWIDNESELKAALEIWLKEKLMPFIKMQLEPYIVWGTQRFVHAKIDDLVPSLAAQVQGIIWAKDQYALKVLLFHYLLPVWRSDIIKSVLKDT